MSLWNKLFGGNKRPTPVKAVEVGDAKNQTGQEEVDINAKDKYGWTALISALAEGNLAGVQALLDKGADVNAKEGSMGWTALMDASEAGHLTVVRTLLDRGADVNAKTYNGTSALEVATTRRHDQVRSLLVQVGINAGRDFESRTVASWAGRPDQPVSRCAAAGAVPSLGVAFKLGEEAQ